MDGKYTGQKKVAVLIDAENIDAKYHEAILDIAKKEGSIVIKRAYNNIDKKLEHDLKDYSKNPPKNEILSELRKAEQKEGRLSPDKAYDIFRKRLQSDVKEYVDNLRAIRNQMFELAITPVQFYVESCGKNTGDMYLMADAMELLRNNDVDVFCIASSDSDFVPLATKLREAGKYVIGIGEKKTLRSFRNACNEFTVLDESLVQGNETDGSSTVTVSDETVKPAEVLIPEIAADEAPAAEITATAEMATSVEVPTIAKEAEEETEEKIGSNSSENNTVDEEERSSDKRLNTNGNKIKCVKDSDKYYWIWKCIIFVLNNCADENGRMPLTKIIPELKSRLSGFDLPNYGVRTATEMMHKLGIEIEDEGTPWAYISSDKLQSDDHITFIDSEELKALKQLIVKLIQKAADDNGRYNLSKLYNELQRIVPDFSHKNYELKSFNVFAELMYDILELEKRYHDPKNPKNFSAFVRVKQSSLSPFDRLKSEIASPEEAPEIQTETIDDTPAETVPETEETSDGHDSSASSENNAATDIFPSYDQVKADIEEILSATTEEDGLVRVKAVSEELNKKYPFDPENYGCKMNALLKKMGFKVKVKNSVSYLRLPQTVDGETISETTEELPEITEETVAEVPEAETEIPEETAPETDTNTENESEAETESAETTEISETTEEITEAAEENSDEQEYSDNGIPLYVELPDAIDTKEQLRNAIIFILSTESVTSATRLSAPLKRYYPDFKIKNYGHNKMKSLLEELGLFVF